MRGIPKIPLWTILARTSENPALGVVPDFLFARIGLIVGVGAGAGGRDPINRYRSFDRILLDTGGFRGIL